MVLYCLLLFVDALDAVVVDGAQELDLQELIDVSPYTIYESASIIRSYRLFTALGLRHLIVLDRRMHVAGILTRSDFMRGSRHGETEGLSVRNPLSKSKRGKYNKIDHSRGDEEEGNFQMNPYSSNTSKPVARLAPSDIIGTSPSDSLVTAKMYPAGVISTYREKINSRAPRK
jgi:hypothetical protein